MRNGQAAAAVVGAADERHSNGTQMTISGPLRDERRNWHMKLGLIEINNVIHPSGDPYKSPHWQTKAHEYPKNIVNMEMVITDYGGYIPAKYQDSHYKDFTIPRFVVSL